VADRRAGLTSGPGGTGTPPSAPPSARRRRAGRFLSGLVAAFVLLVVASVAGLLPVQVMRVDSGSMAPTIAADDLVVLERDAGPVGRRDVVVVPHPDTGTLLVKRVVALGGEAVSIEDGVLVVDSTPVCEPSIDPARLDGVWFGPVTVPDGAVFLLGDERGGSIDSRDFGPVPAGEVTGLVRVRLWPAPGRLATAGC
jgi:signal peptidase I